MNLSESPKEAASRFATEVIKQGYKPQALHEYRNQEGKILYYRMRLKHPITGEKWIRPFKFVENKGFCLGEPNFPQGKPLYNLHKITEQPNATIWICEGEFCVDKLTKLEILSTTSGSADSVINADWMPLEKRKIVIWPDNDEAGQRFACAVLNELKKLDCELWVIDVEKLNLPAKGDVVDWLQINTEATNKEILSLPLLSLSEYFALEELDKSLDQSNPNNKPNQASHLVDFVVERMELFHDESAEAYAFDVLTKETRRLDSRQFKDWLISNYYKIKNKSPSDQSIREAMNILNGLARFEGECHEVHIRMAIYNGDYYMDLAEVGKSRAICIKAGGWEIINNPPVRFLRPNTTRALPEPCGGGDLSSLWQIANISENDRILVIAWLIESMRPDTPFPILELIGEQGSAKSTTQKILRQLIDPNACDLRAAPKTLEDIFVTAGVNWLVSYENISYLSSPIQDTFCVLATGGGFAKRKLYTDADEAVIIAKRPIIINGISAAITAQDLVDRAISIETPTIIKRTESTDIWKHYEEQKPQLLGALLDIFSSALLRLPNIELPVIDCPRLIEFTKLGMAISEVLGQEGNDFLYVFQLSRSELISRTIDANPVASALIEWFEKRSKEAVSLPVKTLFSQVEVFKSGNTDSWPKSPKGFADSLRRLAPALRQMGIDCRSLGKVGSYVVWEIKKFGYL